jgi:hypothetical protein
LQDSGSRFIADDAFPKTPPMAVDMWITVHDTSTVTLDMGRNVDFTTGNLDTGRR